MVGYHRSTVLADASGNRRPVDAVLFWTTVGTFVILVGGVPLFIAWLTPGLPPLGPLG
jgi:hypothetical protein